jgi:hypothetical protein
MSEKRQLSDGRAGLIGRTPFSWIRQEPEAYGETFRVRASVHFSRYRRITAARLTVVIRGITDSASDRTCSGPGCAALREGKPP